MTRNKWERSPEVKARARARQEAKWLPIVDAWVERYRNGETLQEIGTSVGITRERVRQLMTKFRGVTGADGGKSVVAAKNKDARLAARDAQYLREKGCTFEQYKAFRGSRAVLLFTRQKNKARQRGIEWKLTFWQWWTIWQESGHWQERGRTKSQYVMSRYRDRGPYAIGNVHIATASENCSDIWHNRQINKGDRPQEIAA